MTIKTLFELYLIVALGGIITDMVTVEEYPFWRRIQSIFTWLTISVGIVFTVGHYANGQLTGPACMALGIFIGRLLMWVISKAISWTALSPAYLSRRVRGRKKRGKTTNDYR